MNTLKELSDLIEKFETSRPILKLLLDGDRISASLGSPVYRYRPSVEEGNILSEIAAACYSEFFSLEQGKFLVNKKDIQDLVVRATRSDTLRFIELNLRTKSPRQSKIYRWYYRSANKIDGFDNVLLGVYKYLRSFSDDEMRSTSDEHTNNALALLKAIMEKYDE